MTQVANFPSLPGLSWSVNKSPSFATRIQKGVSGRELRVLDQVYPIWEFTLTYNFLRDKHDTRQSGGLGVSYDELRSLAGFFLQMQGQFGAFLFDDPSDDSVLAQIIATGDGATTVFQLVRTFGGFTEPMLAPATVSAIYLNGVLYPSANYSVDYNTGLLTFTVAAPTSGVQVTADFTYLFRCRFSADHADFENFMFQLWTLKQIKFRSVIEIGTNLGAGTIVPINWDYIDLPPTAGNPVLRYTVGAPATLAANLPGAIATATVAATAQTIFDIAQNGTNFGTMTFAVSGTVATFSGTAVSFLAGDVLTITPRTTDATLSGLSGVIDTIAS